MTTIKCTLSTLGAAINALNEYEKSLPEKNRKFLDGLSDIGVVSETNNFNQAQYDGERSIDVGKDWESESKVYVVASGESVGFIEFGSGAAYPDSHPKAEQDWMKHGSWSDSEFGKHHWKDENGWYYAHGRKSHGNPANMCIYYAAREMERNIVKTAREVFGT